VGAVSEMGVAVYKTREHCHLREIDDLGIGRNGERFADSFNFIGFDEDDLVGEDRSRIGVDKTSRFDSGGLSRRCRSEQKGEEYIGRVQSI